MIIEALEKLKTIECNPENVSNICKDKLSDYNYSYGSTKIVIYCNNFVIKKIFEKAPKDEVEVYIASREKKLNRFFATTLKYSEDIYIQQKVDIALNDFVVKEKEQGRTIKYGEMREKYRDMGLQDLLLRSDCCVIYYLLRDYGIEEVLELQKFIVEQDLTDLQLYNAGFYNGKIVFFDYGGTEWWD